MKRVISAGAVVVASLGVVLGAAGTAAAQDPYAKFGTNYDCSQAGLSYVRAGQAEDYTCTGLHASSKPSEKYWLYLK